MVGTRSQKAQLVSPLAATSRKRSGSRATSATPAAPRSPPPPPAPMGQITRAKRKYYVESERGDEGEEEEEVVVREEEREEVEEETPPPKKRTKLQEMQYKEKLIKSVEERTVRRLAEERRARQAMIPPYPAPTAEAPHGAGPTPQMLQSQQQQQQQHPQQQQQQQALQAPVRGFFGRLIDTISPFKRRTPTANTALPDARIDLIQLQQHTRLQQNLNNELRSALAEEEQRAASEASEPDYEQQQEIRAQQPGNKRKRTANEITGLPPLNDIAESPEPLSDTMQTPSREGQSFNGLVPKSLPRPRRTYREARAARARNVNDPPTPAIRRTTHTAPTTPLDKKNDYERIRRLREMQLLQDQQKALEEKLAKLRAEQAAELESQPRKTKRVKLDQLKSIPHNRPGESSGCFRVPEGDSDDEMEVDESAELIDNAFTPEPSRPASPVKTPAVPATKAATSTPATSLFKTPAVPASATKLSQPANPFQTLDNNTTPKPTPSTSLFKSPLIPATETPKPSRATSPLKVSSTPVPALKPTPQTEQSDEQRTPKNHTTSATPPTPQLVADAEEDEDSEADYDWPELPQRDPNQPEAPQWFKEEAHAAFEKGFAHWMKTGELLPDSDEE